jgi:hypothetical protein
MKLKKIFIKALKINAKINVQTIKCDNTNVNINSFGFNQLTQQQQQQQHILNQIQKITRGILIIPVFTFWIIPRAAARINCMGGLHMKYSNRLYCYSKSKCDC